MPIFIIKNSNSPAKNHMAAWFDVNKPRSAPKRAKQMALKRMNIHRRLASEKPIRQNQVHSFHHLNLDRSTPDAENLFACVSEEQHNNIELQVNEWFTTLFNMGKIGFDYVTKKYFIADKYLGANIQEWVKQGRPNRWDIRDLHCVMT